MSSLFKRLVPDRFLLILLATVALAILLPARGGFASAVSVIATVAIMLLFFFYGAKIAREDVKEAVTHWRLHITILAATYAVFPLLGIGLHALMPDMLSPVFWTGVLYLCLLPSTVQSSIVFTSMAGGNVPGALASASASNLLGVLITPLLVTLVMGRTGGSLSAADVGTILLEVLLPFVAGQALYHRINPFVTRHRAIISRVDRSAILISVYSAFSAAVVGGMLAHLDAASLIRLLVVCLILLALILAVTILMGRLFGFVREDRIAILFCGSKKSLVTGIPMARVLFHGPDAGLMLLPLMLFHQIQLMVCAAIANSYARGKEKL